MRGAGGSGRFSLIVVDTKIISETMRPAPTPAVLDWMNAQKAEALFVSAITLMELRVGIERLPEGRRKTALWELYHFSIGQLFADRILLFDGPAAEEAARITAKAEAAGRTASVVDIQIAATASLRDFAVATRDTDPFETAGLTVINPWAVRS